MADQKKMFEVCVFMNIEATSLEDANATVADWLCSKRETIDNFPRGFYFAYLPAHEHDNLKQRVYYTHPEKYSLYEWEKWCERGDEETNEY